MIPELAPNSKIHLLRCSRFPKDWQLARVRCEGASLFDTTLFHLDDNWYFSSYTVEDHVFYSPPLECWWIFPSVEPDLFRRRVPTERRGPVPVRAPQP